MANTLYPNRTERVTNAQHNSGCREGGGSLCLGFTAAACLLNRSSGNYLFNHRCAPAGCTINRAAVAAVSMHTHTGSPKSVLHSVSLFTCSIAGAWDSLYTIERQGAAALPRKQQVFVAARYIDKSHSAVGTCIESYARGPRHEMVIENAWADVCASVIATTALIWICDSAANVICGIQSAW